MRTLINLIFAVLAVSSSPAEHSDNMIILGSVKGMSYLTDLVPRNWDASFSFCESKGMRLATITSEAQAEFLKCAYDPINFNGYYWMGSRTNKYWSRWGPDPTWMESDERVIAFARVKLTDWDTDYRYNNCLVYDANNHQTGQFLNRPCENEYFTLCTSSQSFKPVKNVMKGTIKSKSDLIELGTFGEKIYYGNIDNRTWIESMSFCKINGLLQAKIRGHGQRKFLKAACAQINCDNLFWTAKTERNSGFKKKCFERLELCPDFDANYSFDNVNVCTEKHYTLCESVEYTPFARELEWGSDDFEDLERPICRKAVDEEGFTTKATNFLLNAAMHVATMQILSANQKKSVYDILNRMGLLEYY